MFLTSLEEILSKCKRCFMRVLMAIIPEPWKEPTVWFPNAPGCPYHADDQFHENDDKEELLPRAKEDAKPKQSAKPKEPPKPYEYADPKETPKLPPKGFKVLLLFPVHKLLNPCVPFSSMRPGRNYLVLQLKTRRYDFPSWKNKMHFFAL